MENLFRIMLAFHIAAGTTGLIVAPVAMLTVKGGKAHRFWGKIFFWAMCVIAVSAVVMSCIHVNLFLLAVAFFSFQLACNGYRAIYHKPIKGVIAITWYDWIVAAYGLAAGIGLIAISIYLFLKGDSFGTVALVFGGISTGTALRSIYEFQNPPSDPKAWWYAHMRGMMTAYIAMVTAFSAVNFTFLPPVLRWLWPTMLIVPLMVAWIVYYKKKFRASARAKEAALIAAQRAT